MTTNELCPDCGVCIRAKVGTCGGCGWRRYPARPARVDRLARRLNAAVLSGRLTWIDVARSTNLHIGQIANLKQGHADVDGESRVILETILSDVEVGERA